jgi:ATP-dependent RNA helicase DDX28
LHQQWLGATPILEGRHTLLAAETGCGKSLAYLLPIIQQVLEWKSFMPQKLNAPLALIIVPNRELVKQIYVINFTGSHFNIFNQLICKDVVVRLTENLPIVPFHLIGGSTKKKMTTSSYDVMDILVATPSVLSKLTSVKLLDMHNVRHAVLDEADTLLDDSFSGYIQNFLSKLPV